MRRDVLRSNMGHGTRLILVLALNMTGALCRWVMY